ncbi:hypothetical protein K435DRAFT_378692 [Dendrothele bispora CBS 962.96]|uniref:Uncharacterized protein n=1 Tax=Dendrothele bispora (strain CBS 962.96) TaxID=1314807 RepID=A0A4S8LAH5_DENBC|nr:hypothetical protein K435DRAFT_378692 [Dendrothele bispora CBS 962.96]
MHPSPAVYRHPLLRTVKPETVTPGLQRLYDLAWKDRDRERLFQREAANNDSGLNGFQYESVISTEGLEPLHMGQRVLITPEYKAALSDAKHWFSGGTILPTDDVEMRSADEKAPGKEAPGGEVPWPANPDPRHHIFIVIGTPGVGKSLFLYYILVERLLAGLPTCFQTLPGFFTFWCEEGVFRIPLDEKDPYPTGLAIPADAWFLVDSNDMYPIPDDILQDVKACVVQAAPPRDDHIWWTDNAHTTFTGTSSPVH